jgi:ribulose-5-phosphate 4-epimerase/fuculose-1-phosphate aldolase
MENRASKLDSRSAILDNFQGDPMAANLKEMKEKLAYSCNILAHEGHWDNILGHVSVRIQGENRILMKPHSFGFEEIRPQHIIVVDIETGKKVEGKHERHSEVFIHTEIMKARPDVNCVVHSHPPYATAFGALGQRLRPISHEGNIFYDGLPTFDYTTALIRTPELGVEVAKSLGKCRGLLMKNHGSTVVGESIEVATLYSIFLEKSGAHSTDGHSLRRSVVDQRRGIGGQVRADLHAAPAKFDVGILRAPRQEAEHER